MVVLVGSVPLGPFLNPLPVIRELSKLLTVCILRSILFNLFFFMALLFDKAIAGYPPGKFCYVKQGLPGAESLR